MAKLDHGWIFVAGQAQLQSTARPVLSNAALNENEAKGAENEVSKGSGPPTSGLLWRNARWMQSVREPKTTSMASPLSPRMAERTANVMFSGKTSLNGDLQVVPTRFHHQNEQRRFGELVQHIRQTVTLGDILAFLEQWCIDDIIEAVPQSLPLLEAIYGKFYGCDRKTFPLDVVKPEKLLSQLLWWVAHEEGLLAPKAEEPTTPKTLAKRPHPTFKWHIMITHVRNILRMIHATNPAVTESLRLDHCRLTKALEGMGLHGLVNCGQNKLIEVTDAVRIEIATHQHSVKLYSQQLDKLVQSDPKVEHPMTMFLYSINGSGSAPVPTKSSHQRLMNVRLTDIRDRLHRNEYTLQILQGALRNSDLLSLERILKKRIAYDKDIIHQFNCIFREPNPCFSIACENPVVAQVLVHFKSAYEKLLEIIPLAVKARIASSVTRDDSGLGDDDDEGCSSPEHTGSSEGTHSSSGEKYGSSGQHSSDSHPTAKSGRLLGPVANLIRARSKRFVSHRSLADLRKPSQPSPVISEVTPPITEFDRNEKLNSLKLQKQSLSLQNLEQIESRNCDRTTKSIHSQSSSDQDRLEAERMRCELASLRVDLEMANRRIRQLDNEKLSNADSDIHLLESVRFQKRTTTLKKDVSSAVHNYSNMFTKDRVEMMAELCQLPELLNAEELQMKIIFTVVVLAFRSVQEILEEKRKKVLEALEIPVNTEENSPLISEIEVAVYRYLSQKASSNGWMNNAKEVTSQLWQTLYDFPSLKTCTRFNRFILESIRIAWDLCAGVNGLSPRYNLEYDSLIFDGEKHLRFHSSSLRSEQIRRYVWPGLKAGTASYLGNSSTVYKAVVVT